MIGQLVHPKLILDTWGMRNSQVTPEALVCLAKLRSFIWPADEITAVSLQIESYQDK